MKNRVSTVKLVCNKVISYDLRSNTFQKIKKVGTKVNIFFF
ncbi:hypothetical protein P689_12327 [Candidatus Riesia pediculischaeffi PTSU]|uniref:Uncharacterized protein n=1 Tax=Candidatus Riesia pediculischaeffi PTSU TaxID=1401651 RepID=A0A0C1V911_9ENTR|nr:hypothetical protein P689_12327 [Candidatus Riesia pediculischaeffi PTSU]